MGGRKPSTRREPVFGPSRPQAAAGDSMPTKPKRPRKRGGGSAVSRLVYWVLVLGLWGVIATVARSLTSPRTLPPIQSLEVPKRPPTVEMVGLDGKEWSRAAR